MKLKSIVYTLLLSGVFIISSCSSDDTDVQPVIEVTENITVPKTYTFERKGESTVSFGGQTTRIAMATVLTSALKNTDKTKEALNAIFDHKEGAADFEDAALNKSGKSVRSKVAASKDYFSANATNSVAIKSDFDSWISSQTTEVYPNWSITASAGVAGSLEEGGADPATRYVTGKGLELNQAFAKGLIGALMADQILNNYLSNAVLDEADNVVNNGNQVVAKGKSYTTMEHKWDEAYGYVYGASADIANPNATIGKDDNFLNKYIGRVEKDSDYAGIANQIFEAFKLGRAAIVAKDYKVRDEQVKIIRAQISKVIAVRAIYYLQQGKKKLEATTVDYASAFHDLSEGYGFVYSLQFTRPTNEIKPGFTKTEVDEFLKQMIGGTTGFWEVTPATLEEISKKIATTFGLSLEEAGS